MDHSGRLNESGLALAMGRRPHLAAVLRLWSKNWERMMEAEDGGFLRWVCGTGKGPSTRGRDKWQSVQCHFQPSRAREAKTFGSLRRGESAARVGLRLLMYALSPFCPPPLPLPPCWVIGWHGAVPALADAARDASGHRRAPRGV